MPWRPQLTGGSEGQALLFPSLGPSWEKENLERELGYVFMTYSATQLTQAPNNFTQPTTGLPLSAIATGPLALASEVSDGSLELKNETYFKLGKEKKQSYSLRIARVCPCSSGP